MSWNMLYRRSGQSCYHAKWFWGFKLWCFLFKKYYSYSKHMSCLIISSLILMQKSKILWTQLTMRKIETCSLGLCLCEECCLHLCFSYYRLGSPWDIEGQPIRRSHAGGKSLHGSYNTALLNYRHTFLFYHLYVL